MLYVNSILFRRQSNVILDLNNVLSVQKDVNEAKKQIVVTALKNIEAYGYTFSENLFQELLNLEEKDIVKFYKDLLVEIEKITGANRTYRPMYPNFPEQVVNASDSELVMNALVHYWSCGEILPDYPKEKRFPLIDNHKLITIDVKGYNDLVAIRNNLLYSHTNLSQQDYDDLTQLLEYFPHEGVEIDSIINKEIKTFICTYYLKKNDFFTTFYYIDTATDLLRVVTWLSNGDASLATNTKFKGIKRCQREFILNNLERLPLNNCLEDMFRYRDKWVRVGEVLHPSEWIKKYPDKYHNVDYLFEKIRANDKPLFWGGQVEKALNEGDVKKAIDLLVQRPGEYARRLEYLLCIADDKQDLVCDTFSSLVNKIPTTLLWQILCHFRDRKTDDYKVFFPKGNTAKFFVRENYHKEINQSTIDEIIKICKQGLYKQYDLRDQIGKVYVDDSLKNYIVPFSQRSASSGSKILTRGSRIKLPEDTRILRPFIWWTNISDNNRVDLDLSVGIYNNDCELLCHVSYTQLRDAYYRIYHSGDITNGGSPNGDGVAEFVDINIEEIAAKARYIVVQVYSFTEQPFSNMSNCSFGWMGRTDLNSGEIFEPKTVENIIDVRANATYCVPAIIDCWKKEIIWCDISFSRGKSNCWGNNLESNRKNTDYVIYAMTHLRKPNLYELCILNGLARGILTNNRNEADIIFDTNTEKPIVELTKFDEATGEIKTVQEESNSKIITPYDVDYIMSNLL